MVPKPVYNKSTKRHGSMQQTLFARQDERELNDAKVTITKLEKELRILLEKTKKERLELEALGAGFKAEIISLQKSLKVDKRKVTELENAIIETNTIKSKFEVELSISIKTLNSLDPDSTQHFQPSTLLKLEENTTILNDILTKLKSSKESLDHLESKNQLHNYDILKCLPEEINKLTQDLKDSKEKVPHLNSSIIRAQSRKASIPIWSKSVQDLKKESQDTLNQVKPIQKLNDRITSLLSKHSLIESTLRGGKDMHNAYVNDSKTVKLAQGNLKDAIEKSVKSIEEAKENLDRLENRLTELDTRTALANSLIEPLTESLRTAKLFQIKIVNNFKSIESNRQEISNSRNLNEKLILSEKDLILKINSTTENKNMISTNARRRKEAQVEEMERKRKRIEREEEEEAEQRAEIEMVRRQAAESERFKQEFRIVNEEIDKGKKEIATLENLLASKSIAREKRLSKLSTPNPIRLTPTPTPAPTRNHQLKSSLSAAQVNTPSQLVVRLASTMKSLSEGLKILRDENTELLLQLVEVDC